MSNFLQHLHIRNFKSIQSLALDCKRVNVFIGKPNVGKSNILEALSLLGAHYGMVGVDKFMEGMIRYDEMSNWFYDDDVMRVISVQTDKVDAQVRFHVNRNKADFMFGQRELVLAVSQKNDTALSVINSDFGNQAVNFQNHYAKPFYVPINLTGETGALLEIDTAHPNPIKPFRYAEGQPYGNKFSNFLVPPTGNNLFGVVDRDRDLRTEIAEMFQELGLDFVLSRKDGKFELQKNVDGIVYKYPYTGIADTFKRFIFYLAAIESNRDSVLILEEPEVHAFPPYTKQLADRIALRTENQFFLNTHSPYLLNTLIEVLGDDELAVSLVYFENYETKVHTLTSAELREVQDFSIDVFFNLDKFVANGAAST